MYSLYETIEIRKCACFHDFCTYHAREMWWHKYIVPCLKLLTVHTEEHLDAFLAEMKKLLLVEEKYYCAFQHLKPPWTKWGQFWASHRMIKSFPTHWHDLTMKWLKECGYVTDSSSSLENDSLRIKEQNPALQWLVRSTVWWFYLLKQGLIGMKINDAWKRCMQAE